MQLPQVGLFSFAGTRKYSYFFTPIQIPFSLISSKFLQWSSCSYKDLTCNAFHWIAQYLFFCSSKVLMIFALCKCCCSWSWIGWLTGKRMDCFLKKNTDLYTECNIKLPFHIIPSKFLQWSRSCYIVLHVKLLNQIAYYVFLDTPDNHDIPLLCGFVLE